MNFKKIKTNSQKTTTMKNRKLFIVGIDVSRSLTERSFGTSNLSRHQCDQMLELKVAQIFPKVDKKGANTVFTK